MPMTTIDPAVQAAHDALWARFVDERGIVLDYVGLDGELSRPTPEECRLCQPNGLSWCAPNENGSFFGGVYLEGLLNRWRLTGSDADRERARRIASGLMLLATVGERPGFIARGVSDDDHSHFPIGSNDQTSPWLMGLWRYVTSDAPKPAERDRIIAQIVTVAEVLRECHWWTPCDRPPFDFRNCLAEMNFENAPRLPWLCLMMAQLTGDAAWRERYEAVLSEPDPDGGPTRLEICRRGMVWERPGPYSWTAANCVTALRGLWEMDDDPARKQAYAEGLRRSAELAAESLPLALQFDHDDPRPFSCNWRVANELWHEQQTVAEAVELGRRQYGRLHQDSPRWPVEARLVREPLFAAWIVTLCPDAELVAAHTPAIMQALRHFQYDRLYLSQFFAGELAYYQLQQRDLR
ncbi:MAG: hypothetical protein KKI08_08740 [Armatimonadetes bacterium]|nr:hypothetical protein [Armatimonadota bacterium]